ncbi:TlpA family protein disulfide reductase [Microbacterium sp.]|uniref:TlpA family protein disulfide reductase n=1 Tax=Microbacterium sp. TaxID=51671 RepID=UPI001AC15891|nr:TlpA family protein disulfide reductase [Microbacterium sp.]MBN9194009.1 SCO family protein [Microbacterium sp.]
MSSPGTDDRDTMNVPGWALWLSSAALVVVIAVLVTIGVAARTPSAAAPSPDTVPAGMNQATADLLGVAPVPTDPVTAPGYRLTDQHGHLIGSSDLRGRVVVLTFNDDRCLDQCAMLATDIVAADHDLAPAARAHIAFVSINANPYYPAAADVKSWTDQHGLGALSNWYFLTGTPAQLAAAARAYAVPIQLDPATRSVSHGSQIFVIGASGHIVEQAAFGAEAADTAPFGHGLAALANDALRSSRRGPVGGANLTTAVPGGTDIGDTPAPLSGPALAGTTTTSAASRGRYTVVDFWSSTCAACSIQLPDDQAEARSLGASVAFLGVDVDDDAATGRAILARDHVAFPTLRDPQGTLAARFRVSELPYTVILSPTGTVVVRHPGLFTTEELDYVLHSLDTALPPTG